MKKPIPIRDKFPSMVAQGKVHNFFGYIHHPPMDIWQMVQGHHLIGVLYEMNE